MKRFAIPIVALVLLFLGVAWWLALSRTGAVGEPPPDSAPRASAAKPAAARSEVIGMRPPLAPLTAPAATPVQAARYELRDAIRDAADLRAYYERTKDLPDPTGERAYRFAEAIFLCTPFMDLPTPQLSARLAMTPKARENPRRQEAFNAILERCKGFAGNPAATAELVQALHRKAEAAGYPAEVARSLRLEAGRRDPEWADRTAQAMLSVEHPDPDVVHELAQYVSLRMISSPGYRGTDAGVRSMAWGLLECEYGADCGPRSQPVLMTCVAYGACELSRIEEAVLVQGSQAAVNSSIAMRDRLARQIAERDWNAIGLVPAPIQGTLKEKP